MNKWQIICPIAAMGLCLLVFGSLAIRGYNKSPAIYLAGASQVGQDLVTKSNSDRLTPIGPALRTNLLAFLASPARTDSVRSEVPDEGKPTVVLYLVNDAGHRFRVHLRWEPKLRRFTPIAYQYPAVRPPPPPE